LPLITLKSKTSPLIHGQPGQVTLIKLSYTDTANQNTIIMERSRRGCDG